MIKTAKRLEGIGTYYFADKLAQIRRMNEAGDRVINLGIGSPDMLPPAAVIERLKEAVHEPEANMYQSYRSLPSLRGAFAKWYQDYFDVSLNPATELLPLIGSKEGIMHIAMTFLGPGDQALVPDPGYPAYASATKLAGAEPVLYSLEQDLNWRPDLKALAGQNLSAVKIMWINYPNMPTGAQADSDFFADLIAFAKAHEILICHDNPYAFILNEDPLSILEIDGAIDHALELSSLSKCYNMAGWRVGCLAGKEDYVNAVLTYKSNMDSGMFKAVQEAAVIALQQDKDWFATLNDEYKRRKEWAQKIMVLLGCKYEEDTAGLFVWAEIPSLKETAEAYSEEILAQAKVFITPGMVFGEKGSNHLRISLCGDLEIFKEAHRRITAAIEKKNILLENTN